MKKCTECKLFFKETTPQYYRRIKNGLNSPYVCYDCQRIAKYLSDHRYKENPLKEKIEHKLKEKNKFMRWNMILPNSDIEISRSRFEIRKKMFSRKSKKRINLFNLCGHTPKMQNDRIRNFYEKKPPGLFVDHITPLSIGGTHTVCNLHYVVEYKQSFDPILHCVLEAYSKNQKISVAYLMRKFKLRHGDAKIICDEIFESSLNLLVSSSMVEYRPVKA